MQPNVFAPPNEFAEFIHPKGLPKSDSPLRSHTPKVVVVRPNVCASTATISLLNSAKGEYESNVFPFLSLFCAEKVCCV